MTFAREWVLLFLILPVAYGVLQWRRAASSASTCF